MDINEFKLQHKLRVRWAEVDMQAIVFNGHYLTYFDVAIAEYWRAAGLPYPSGVVDRFGVDFFVVKATVEYHASAKYDDEITVVARCSQLGRSSLRYLMGIFRGDERLISGELIYVCADAKTQKSVPIPQPLRDVFTQFETVPPQQ
jgi:acyl-CoA thioester hydrolase